MNLFWIILFPILTSTICYLIPIKVSKYLSLVVQILMVGFAFHIFLEVKQNGLFIQNIGEWPDYIGIALRADPLAAVMTLLTTFIFLIMGIFQLKSEYVNRLFLFLFLALEGLIVGIFLSNDLFNIFVLVEVATVVVSILIMFKRDSQAIYDGILYLLVNVVSMSFFLLGLGILYKSVGVIDFYGVEEAVKNLKSPGSLILPYGFIITSVSLKAALMPLFSWLPKAHGTPSAPSTVSAILSGLYVKTGVYLFLRVQNMFSSQIDTQDIFLIMGFLTAVIGFVLAIAQKDIKLILAYSTVSQIGLIMMGINMESQQAKSAGMYHIINHALFKSTLFLTAGMISEGYKTRNIHEIKGVFKRMPMVSIATILAVMGIIGAPFFNGSISKYWIAYGAKESWAEYGIMFVNLGTLLCFIRYSVMFTGECEGKKVHTDFIQRAVVFIMGILCFLGGVFGEQIIYYLFRIDLIMNYTSYFMKILAFMATLFMGIAIYKVWLRKSNISSWLNKFELSFNGVCLVITIFFLVMISYLRFNLSF